MLLPIKLVCAKNKMRKDGTSIIFIQYCYSPYKRTLLNTGIAIPPKFWLIKRMSISTEMPECFGNPDLLNDRLKHLVRRAEDIVLFAVKKKLIDPVSLLNEYFNQNIDISGIEKLLKEKEAMAALTNPRLNLDIYFQIDDYIKSKSQKVSAGMLRIYKNMKDHLQAFEEYRKDQYLRSLKEIQKEEDVKRAEEYQKLTITFESFDLSFYESFINYLSYDYIQRRRKKPIHGLKVNTIGKTIKQLRIFFKKQSA